MKHDLTNVFKKETLQVVIWKKMEHWVESLENFHKKYIILTLEWLNSSFPEESMYVAVWSTPGFINR